MLSTLHTTIQHLLFDAGKLPDEVDVRSEIPDKQWVGSLAAPTLNFYLFDVQENTELRQTAMQQSRGSTVQRMPPRRFDLRYMVSAFSSVAADEQLLIWRALAVLLKHQQFPPEVLAATMQELLRREGALKADAPIDVPREGQRPTHEELRAFVEGLAVPGWAQERLNALKATLLALVPDPPLTTKIVRGDDGPRLLDLWSALDVPPHPALLYVVTTPLDLEIAFEAPLVLTRTTRYTRGTPGDEAAGRGIDPRRITARDEQTAAPLGGILSVATLYSIGGVVRSRAGLPVKGITVQIGGDGQERAVEALTGADGRFTLGGLHAGPAQLRALRGKALLKAISVAIPSDVQIDRSTDRLPYDIDLD